MSHKKKKKKAILVSGVPSKVRCWQTSHASVSLFRLFSELASFTCTGTILVLGIEFRATGVWNHIVVLEKQV